MYTSEQMEKQIDKINHKINEAEEIRNEEIYYEIKKLDEKYETIIN